ncbi:MAG: protease [Microbacteriaceae bacterium]|nr:protease [Microbacteriaceae bacterium]
MPQASASVAPDRRPHPAAVPPRGDFVAWKVSIALLIAVGIAATGLHVLLRNQSWWFVVVLVVAVVLGAAALTRALSPHLLLPPVAGAFALLGVVTLLFAPVPAVLGVVPTFDTLDAFGTLFLEANDSIHRQAVPATPDQSIVFVLCIGIGAIALLCDIVAIALRLPALVGVPLVIILAVPAVTARNITDPFVFALAAAAYLFVLVAGTPHRQPGLAVGVAAASIVGALVLPLALPGIDGTIRNAQPGPSAGVNPVLSLGDDLRRSSERNVLEYATDSGEAHYLRLVTLERFTGKEWAPTETDLDTDNTVEDFGPVPGLSADVQREAESTVVEVGNLSSRWLPVPYPPRVITGLDRTWYWEPRGLSVESHESTARGQSYQVESLLIQPTPQQLLAAGTTVRPELEPYLDLPEDLPAVISDAALGVAESAGSNYEKALALQEYFRSETFRYSEDAPVEGEYDGTGMDVLATFLEVRAGYCIHFASAMAVMARSLDIPARVVVGFLPGKLSMRGGETSFSVTTHDLHSWPELYFEGVGWVQFEPTPGRGELGDYADVSVAGVPEPIPPDGSAPGATPVPTPASSPDGTPEAGTDDSGTGAPEASRQGTPWFGLIVIGTILLSLIPALVRAAQRWRLSARLASGDASAIDAWTDTLRTAVDLRLPVASTQTPREAAGRMGGGPALERLLHAVEAEGYAATTNIDSRELAGDLRSARTTLAAAAEPLTRAIATVYPPSLWRNIAHPLTTAQSAHDGASTRN